MFPPHPDVVVIGAGVNGLTTGICLVEQGFDVVIRTVDRPRETTSAAAGAVWDPAHAKHPQAARWSRRTYEVWERLIDAGAGVQFVDGVEAARNRSSLPRVAYERPGFRPCAPRDLPPGFGVGWRCRLPIVDMPVYLDYLECRFESRGGRIEDALVTDLRKVFLDAPTVINCAGIGARDLVGDLDLEPVRGQLVVVSNPGITEFFAEYTDGLVGTYLLPQGDKLLLGGSAERQCDKKVPDAAIAIRIVQECARIHPAVAGARVLGHRVGIRPGWAAQVRLGLGSAEEGHRLVHNYGHGGSGVTLSWGCAEAVLRLLRP